MLFCDRSTRTGVLKMIESRKTAFSGFKYEFTTGKSLNSRKLTLNYSEMPGDFALQVLREMSFISTGM
jgi:hypothetical protein